MKRLFLFVFALFAFVACTQETIDEVSAVRDDAAETITVGFEDDATRIQLNEAQKTVWTKDDLASVFYRSNANQKWQYQGETGERNGTLKRVENAMGSVQTTKTVVVYPYSENYWLNTSSYCIDALLPATQYYAEGSYGVGSNLMVSQSEFTQFSLKSVCGWLKLQLTGNGEVVKSIKFRGNNGEQVAGLIYVDTATAESTLASEMGDIEDNNAGGNLFFEDTILTEVTLDCGAGVELGAEATPFYIALPPQTFVGGFTVEVECDGYELMTLATENELVIERNTIQPMASVEHNAMDKIQNNEIFYTNGSTTTPTEPRYTDRFGANIVSNEYDADNNHWVITFDGEVTTIGSFAFSQCYSLKSVIIPDSVTTIGNYAFRDCSSLTSVTIPDSISTIGGNAFESCSSLTSVTIPDSVTTLGDNPFWMCYSLTEFKGKLASEDGKCLIVDGVLNSFAVSCGVTEYTIPDCVTKIGKHPFYGCNSLTSVTIPDSVTTVDSRPFWSCINLAEFKGKFASEDGKCLIVNDVLNSFAIGCGATEYTIPDNITTIGVSAFEDCSSLTSVTIPESITSVGGAAFNDCYSLKNVYCKAITPPTGNYWMFRNNASDRKIYVPAESVDAYKNAEEWSDYADAIVAYDFENNVEVNSVEFNPNRCIYYRANMTGGWDSGYGNYRAYRSYIVCNAGGREIEMKFRLKSMSGYEEARLGCGSNRAKDECDEFTVTANGLYIIDDYYFNWKWADIGVEYTDLITLRFSGNNQTLTINGKELSCSGLSYMGWYYLFSCYYREYDEGEWKEYEGVPEGSELYYVKMWDANGNLTYLGHAAKAVNPATNNMEYCWYSNKSGTEEYQFAYDAVNQGGYGGNF